MSMTRASVILLAIMGCALSGCTNEPHARKVLAENGYTSVQITGYSWFSCDDKDTFSTGFVATAPGGRKVTGAVCEGWLKNATIRFQ
jgi:hypothetical protein